MKNVNKQSILKYLSDQLTGNFMGFLIGVSATGLVSQFFETRSIKNLWGLSAKKTVIDKETFSYLEWVISIVVGFIFFEIFMKVIKESVARNFPGYRYTLFRWIIRENLHVRARIYAGWLSGKRIVFFTAFNQGVRQAFNRYSKRA